MKKNIILASLIIIALCSACNTEDSINPNVNKENPAETPDTAWIEDVKEEDIFNAESTIREDIDLGEQQQKISQKINEFSWDTFSKIFSDKEGVSLLVSPLSLNQNIMMLSNGLKGETREEILKAFGISDFSLEEINSYILQLNEGLNGADSRTKYRTNNAIWHDNSMSVQQEFKENISGVYDTEIFPALMNTQTLDSINAWASEKTFGRIKNMG
jgi:serpin B